MFSPSTWRKPLCIQKFAMTGVWKAQRDCAISFSWWGNTRSMPPPWMSKVSPRCFHDMAEHSMCQPGRPGALMPAGDGHAGSPGFEGFHSTKSMGSRLSGATAARELAVVGHRRDAEQHVVLRHIGVARRDQALDQRPHLGDMLGRARLDGRAERAERVDVLVELLLGLLGDGADRLVERQAGIF